MRRLLSWPARWLDARIDARIERAERLKVEGVLVLLRAGRSPDEQTVETIRRKVGAKADRRPLSERLLALLEAQAASAPTGQVDPQVAPGRVAGRLGAEALDGTADLSPAWFVHGLDAEKHGLSLERIALDPPFGASGLFAEMPAVGVSFAEISALLNGNVLLSFGTRLPDNAVDRGQSGRFPAEAARALGRALLRAADLSLDAASAPPRAGGHSSPAPHGAPPAHDRGGAA